MGFALRPGAGLVLRPIAPGGLKVVGYTGHPGLFPGDERIHRAYISLNMIGGDAGIEKGFSILSKETSRSFSHGVQKG